MAVKVRNPVLDTICIGFIVVVFLVIAVIVVDEILQKRGEKWFTDDESQDNIIDKQYCDYCGSVLNVHDRQCPCCGAINKNYHCAEK